MIGLLHRNDLLYDHLLYLTSCFSWKTPVKLMGSGLYSAPLTLFNSTKHTIIISPFKEFMVSSLVFDNAEDIIMEGIMGNITEIPKDFVQQTIVYYGKSPGIKTVSLLLFNFMLYTLKSFDK